MFGDFKPFEIMRGFGIRDMFGVTGYDPSGTGLLMCAPMRASERVEDREVERWRMLRAHLLAGLRLQMSLGLAADGDAVLTPRGRVLHAEGAARTSRAREALRQRAHQIDRARSAAGRRDPMGAIEAWRGLVDGTWSLIDRFDRDGRRYLVAHRNDPQVVAPRPLSPRERQILAYAALGYSNKHIAYVLDLAPSTISSHLRSAMRRMGVRDRASLALLWPGLDERRPRASA
jgi:DNA-binding CsgD family transcriptional regulator